MALRACFLLVWLCRQCAGFLRLESYAIDTRLRRCRRDDIRCKTEVEPEAFSIQEEKKINWPEPFADAINVKSVPELGVGIVLFLTCYLNALVLTKSVVFGRVLGTGAFLAFQRSQSVLKKRIYITENGWPLISLAASLPIFLTLVLLTQHLPTTLPDFTTSSVQEALLIVPITEELVFRLWWFDAARSASLSYPVALILDALAFGLWHGLTPQALGFAILGLYWGHLYVKNGTLMIPISMHMLWNLFALANQTSFSSA